MHLLHKLVQASCQSSRVNGTFDRSPGGWVEEIKFFLELIKCFLAFFHLCGYVEHSLVHGFSLSFDLNLLGGGEVDSLGGGDEGEDGSEFHLGKFCKSFIIYNFYLFCGL